MGGRREGEAPPPPPPDPAGLTGVHDALLKFIRSVPLERRPVVSLGVFQRLKDFFEEAYGFFSRRRVRSLEVSLDC